MHAGQPAAMQACMLHTLLELVSKMNPRKTLTRSTLVQWVMHAGS